MSCYAEYHGATKDAAEFRRLAKLTDREHIARRLFEWAAEMDQEAKWAWEDCQHEARADAYYDEQGNLSDDCGEDEVCDE